MRDRKRGVKLAKMFREVLEVDEDLEKIDDLEQALRNAQGATVLAKQSLREIEFDLGRKRALLATDVDDLKVVKKEAEDTISLAKQAAQEIVLEAESEARSVIKKALEQEQMVADRIVVDQERHEVKMKGYLSAEVAAGVAVAAIEKELEELRARIG